MYIWFRFEWIYGVGAVIAVFHDTIITIGLFSLLNKEITLTVIAALLTLVGYSMNDTIVIFDRIRENLQLNRRERLVDVINRSVNQTLSRTVMTSGLTFLTVVALFLFGGPVLHGFSLALVLGIIVGTYSSVFVASPIVLFWHDFADARTKTTPVRGQRAAAAAPVKQPGAARLRCGWRQVAGSLVDVWQGSLRRLWRSGAATYLVERVICLSKLSSTEWRRPGGRRPYGFFPDSDGLRRHPRHYSFDLFRRAAERAAVHVPGGAAAPAAASSSASAGSGGQGGEGDKQFDMGQLTAPKTVPKEIKMIVEDGRAAFGRRRGGRRSGRRPVVACWAASSAGCRPLRRLLLLPPSQRRRPRRFASAARCRRPI